jgi:hypothetical protein
MSEEKKPEVEETSEEQTEECCQGHEEHQNEGCGHQGPWGHHQGHWMRKRMMMHFASMTIEEEVELLENVKARLEDRLSAVNERLTKLKA